MADLLEFGFSPPVHFRVVLCFAAFAGRIQIVDAAEKVTFVRIVARQEGDLSILKYFRGRSMDRPAGRVDVQSEKLDGRVEKTVVRVLHNRFVRIKKDVKPNGQIHFFCFTAGV